MASCSCRPFAGRSISAELAPSRSSYDRSYFYENVVDQPLIHVRVTRKARQDLRARDPVVLETLQSVSHAAFTPKHLEGHDSTDFLRRSSDPSRPTLKTLHERYIGDPPRPLKHCSTTTGISSHDVIDVVRTSIFLFLLAPNNPYLTKIRPKVQPTFRLKNLTSL